MFSGGDPQVPRDDWTSLFPSPYINNPKWSSFRAARRNEALLQKMSKLHSLEVHRGCVNSIWWDETGQYLLSGSDDHRLVITEPYSKKVFVDVYTSHKANIFSAKFLPCSNTRKIVSCAGDGNILYTDLARVGETHNNNFSCHSGTTYELQIVQNDPNSFLSCGEDGTVRWFDLRTKDKCRKTDCKDDILVHIPHAVTSMTMHPFLPYYLAIGSSDSSVRIFDRRMLNSNPGRCKAGLVSKFMLPEMEGKKRRITAVEYRPDGQEILVSFSSDYIYVFDPNHDDLSRATKLCVGKRPSNAGAKTKVRERSPPPMKRLRLRGDWSDTGPNARPDSGGRIYRSNLYSNPAVWAMLMHHPEFPNPSIRAQQMILISRIFLNSESSQQNEGGSGGGQSSAATDDPNAETVSNLESGEQEQQQQQRPSPRPRRPEMNVNLMQRMTDALSRMLNDPSTRLAMRTLSERDRQQRSNSEGHNEPPVAADAAAPPAISGVSPTMSTSATTVEASDPPPPTPSTSSGWGSTPASTSRWRDPEHSPEAVAVQANTPLGNTIGELQESISNMREEFLDRHNVEPGVNLHYGSQGTDSSSISMQRNPSSSSSTSTTAAPARRASSTDDSGSITNLPGPRQITTHPGVSGTNPLTGERQRRRGVSGPPSEPLAISTPQPSTINMDEDDIEACFSDDDCCEFEFSRQIENDAADDDINENSNEEDNNLFLRENNDTTTKRFVRQPPSLQKLMGHRNARTMIKEATWWGNRFILSGSDCGHIFGWDRNSGKLILLLEADRHVVNCIQPHPYDPMIASSGIDYDVKIWTPSGAGNTESLFDEKRAEELTRMNEIMLEETRDTITVPATLMIRMLASLNQIRRAGRLIPRVLERRREREATEAEAEAAQTAEGGGGREGEDEESQNENNNDDDDNGGNGSAVEDDTSDDSPRDDNDHETDEEGML